MTELFAPVIALSAENVTVARENAAAISNLANIQEQSLKVNAKSDNEHKQAHDGFQEGFKYAKKGIDKLERDMSTGHEEIIEKVLATSPKFGVVILSKEGNLQAWNDEGKAIFGGSDDMLGKPLTHAHSKCLGKGDSLQDMLSSKSDDNKQYVDVLELSLPGADEGKWNWFLIHITKYTSVIVLLLLDIGDITRGKPSIVLPNPAGKLKPVVPPDKVVKKEEKEGGIDEKAS
jgi:ubiquitin